MGYLGIKILKDFLLNFFLYKCAYVRKRCKEMEESIIAMKSKNKPMDPSISTLSEICNKILSGSEDSDSP